MKPHSFFKPGDGLMFVSHKYHCVQPVRSGLRRVLVLEFWAGPTRHCPHRCNVAPHLPCSFIYKPEILAASRGLSTLMDALDSGDPAMAALAAAATECLDPLTVARMGEVRQSQVESETATLPEPAPPRRREKMPIRVLLPAGASETPTARRFTVPKDVHVTAVLRKLMGAGHIPEQTWQGLMEVLDSGGEGRLWSGGTHVAELTEMGLYEPR